MKESTQERTHGSNSELKEDRTQTTELDLETSAIRVPEASTNLLFFVGHYRSCRTRFSGNDPNLDIVRRKHNQLVQTVSLDDISDLLDVFFVVQRLHHVGWRDLKPVIADQKTNHRNHDTFVSVLEPSSTFQTEQAAPSECDSILPSADCSLLPVS